MNIYYKIINLLINKDEQKSMEKFEISIKHWRFKVFNDAGVNRENRDGMDDNEQRSSNERRKICELSKNCFCPLS